MPGPNQQTDLSTVMFDPSSIVGGSPNVGALKQGLNLDTSIGNMGGPAPSDSIDLSPQSILKSYEDVGKRQAQLETQKAQSTADIARDYAKNVGGLLSQAKNSYQEPPQFQPTKEETGQLIGLAGTLAVFGALMGGKGNLGSIGAINAMAGMINGYKQGRTDLFNQEKQKYDENMKQVQAHNSQVRQILQDGLEKAKVDLSSAQAEAESKLAAIGADNIKALAHQSGLVQAYNMYATAQQKALTSQNLQLKIAERQQKIQNKQYGPMGVFEQAIPGSSANFTTDSEKKDAQSALEAVGSSAKVLKDSENPNIKFGQAPVLWQNIKQRIRANLEGMGFKDDGKSTYYTQLPNGQTLGEYIQSQIAQTPVDPNDQNAVFQKETAFNNFDVERAARGGSVLPVGFLKVSGPLLDPKQYTREAFQAVYQDRVNSLDRKLSSFGFDQEGRKKIYDTYGKVIGYPVLNVNGKTSQLPSGLPDGSTKIGKTPDGKKDVWQTPDGKKYAIDAGVQ